MAFTARLIAQGDPEIPPAIPTGLYVVSGLMMVGILAVQRRLQTLQRLVWPNWTWQALGLFLAIVSSYAAAQISWWSEDRLVTEQQAVPLWLLSILGALVCVWPAAKRRTPESAVPRWEMLVLLGIVALAFLLRVPDLRNIPYALMGDETKFAMEARGVLEGRIFKPFTTAVDGHWAMFFSVMAAFMRALGQSVEVIRLHSALAGVLSVLATYALARQLWGGRVALIAAALLATYHYHIHFSRNAMNNVYDALFLVLIFGWLWRGWLTGRRVPWLMAALAAGLAQYFYVGGRLILIEIAVLGLFWLVTHPRQLRARAFDIVASISLCLAVAMPVVYFAQKRPDDYLTRINQSNVIQSGWLQSNMAQRGVGAVEILGEQFRDVLKLFAQGPDELFYTGQSLLTPVMLVLAALSLIYLVSRLREGRAFWLLSSLGLIVLFGGVLTVGPMSGSQRLLGAAPLLYIGIAVFIDQLLTWAGEGWNTPRVWRALGAAFVGALMLLDANIYFGQYVPARVINSPDIEWSMQVASYLSEVEGRQEPSEWQVVCDGGPSLYCEHSTIRFLAPRLSQRAQTINQPLLSTDIRPGPGVGLIVFVSADRLDEATAIAQQYPSAIRRDHYGVHGDYLFSSLEIPPSAAYAIMEPHLP